MKQFLVGLLYENGAPSLTRAIPFAACIVLLAMFCIVTIIVLYFWFKYGRDWPQYGTFVTAALGGSAGGSLMVLGNKVNNSLLCSPSQQPYIKQGGIQNAQNEPR